MSRSWIAGRFRVSSFFLSDELFLRSSSSLSIEKSTGEFRGETTSQNQANSKDIQYQQDYWRQKNPLSSTQQQNSQGHGQFSKNHVRTISQQHGSEIGDGLNDSQKRLSYQQIQDGNGTEQDSINSPTNLAHFTQNMTSDQAYQLRRVREAHEREQFAQLQNSKDTGFGISDQNSIYSTRGNTDPNVGENSAGMLWPGNVPGLSRPPEFDKFKGVSSQGTIKSITRGRGTSRRTHQEFGENRLHAPSTRGKSHITEYNNTHSKIDVYEHQKHQISSEYKIKGGNQGNYMTGLDSAASNSMLTNNKYGGTASIRQREHHYYGGGESTQDTPSKKTVHHVKLTGISAPQNLPRGSLNSHQGKHEPDNFALPLPGSNIKKQKSTSAAPIWENQYKDIDENPALSVEQILEKIRNKHGKKTKKATPDGQQSPGIKMVGKSKYILPSNQTLRESLKGNIKQQKNKQVTKLANNSSQMEGTLLLSDIYEKRKRSISKEPDPMKDYVMHFTEAADIINVTSTDSSPNKMMGFASAIRFNMQKAVAMENVGQAMLTIMKESKRKRELREQGIDPDIEDKTAEGKQDDFDINQQHDIFEKSMDEESKTVQNVAQDLLRKVKYQKIFKSNQLEAFDEVRKDTMGQSDPRIKYFQQCSKELSVALPILDKIYKKTICLQDYSLTEGHCKGLAAACQLFDPKEVNRILFSNCGITGDQFAMILEGLANMSDFKSIIYRMNGINQNSLMKLTPLLQKRLPHHLEELRIIDCKMSGSLIEQLLSQLLEQSQLRKLGLVNVLHGDGPYGKVIVYLSESKYLEDLDISWSTVRPATTKKLIETLKENRQLRCLNLGFNSLLCKQNNRDLTKLEIEQGMKEVPLREENVETMNCFMDFIKYNPYLIHLDLTNTGLYEPALRYIAKMLTRSGSLQSIHLCNNPGLSKNIVDWMRKRISAADYIEPLYIKPYKKVVQDADDSIKKAPGIQGAFLKLLGIDKQVVDSEHTKWKKIRQGMKLRSIISSKRMNQLGQSELIRPALFCDQDEVEQSQNVIDDGQKLIIVRHLGSKQMIPGSGQWRILTDQREECWYTGQHILTLFIWTPRIGQLGGSKDKGQIDHYRSKIEETLDLDFMPEPQIAPKIASSFTDWRYKEMRNIVDFCRQEDPYAPDFLGRLIDEGVIRRECGGDDKAPLIENERNMLKNQMESYYKENWSKVILVIMRYKNPLIANVNQITSLTISDTTQDMYFHIDWLKPGRHVYAVQHDPDEIYLSDDAAEDGKEAEKMKANIRQQKGQGQKSKQTFYIHEMLASFRPDDIPVFVKKRNVKKHTHDFYKPKPVFKNFVRDTPEIMAACISHDARLMRIDKICEGRVDEEKVIDKQVRINYQVIKDIFTILQSRSRTYPFVDTFSFRQYFVREIGVMDDGHYKLANFDVLLSEVCASQPEGENGVKIPKGSMCRYQFIELCIKMGKYLYSTGYMYRRHGRHSMTRSYTTHDENFQEVSIQRAFFVFIEETLKPYYAKVKRDFDDFRNDKLWDESVETVFTMNEKAINDLYTMYGKMNQGSNGKPWNSTQMTVQECLQLFKFDSPLKLTRGMIRQAFALCKMTIPSELEQKAQTQYLSVSHVEFLELVARVAELYFRDSEMDDLMLSEKIEYILDDLFPLVGAERTIQRIVIDEFSDSDDEY